VAAGREVAGVIAELDDPRVDAGGITRVGTVLQLP